MAGSARTLTRVARRVLLRPRLYAAALRGAWRFRARHWWRRPPFLPLPPRDYLEWRLHTAYGDDGRDPTADELERYLRWMSRMGARREGQATRR